jgi:hypothetical protein
MLELELLAKELAPVITKAVDQAKVSLRAEFEKDIACRDAKIAELESQLKLIQSIDIKQIAQEAALLIPDPKDGADGKDGESVSFDDVKKHVDEFLSAIPIPKNGVDGKSASVEEVAAFFERRFSDLTLSWERQARDTFEKAVDKMPIPENGKNGKDGKDALSVDDISLDFDGERNLTISLGEKSKSIKLPIVIDRGVYLPESSYEKGDGTTYGGSFWIAQKDSPEGAPGSSPDWRLAVKKGRDGKDLRDNASKADVSKGVSIK